jgi:uncharacterized protein YjiS (DUF1127 family)
MTMSTLTATHPTVHAATAETSTSFISRVAKALAIRRERRALLALDDRMLADVGLSRTDAYREAHRPLFDLPRTDISVR